MRFPSDDHHPSNWITSDGILSDPLLYFREFGAQILLVAGKDSLDRVNIKKRSIALAVRFFE
jgi:hypothetical protein